MTARTAAGLSLVSMLMFSATALAAPHDADLSAPTPVIGATYHSSSGGFSLAVPVGWSTDESVDADGATTLTLTSMDGAQGIVVRAAQAAAADSVDLPNQMCAPVSVSGMSGQRCVDTLSRATIVTLSGPTSSFQLVTAQRGDPSIFEQVLASFAADTSAAPAADPSAPPAQIAAPLSAPVGDPCAAPRTTPISKASPLCPMP